MDAPSINGFPVVRLTAEGPETDGVVSADIAPGRGMMLLQARGRVAGVGQLDLLHAPALAQAARSLEGGGADDVNGNLSFSFGGALLLPYANRIRGQAIDGVREIETEVAGRTVRLPRNWGGRAPGAEQYAMHGLILDRGPDRMSRPSPARLVARFDLGDFNRRWPSRTVAEIEWALRAGALRLSIRVTNAGDEVLPMGIGWHPYFALGGERRQARLLLPAARRIAVDNYDEVLPTGRLLAVAGTPYDFTGEDGAALGDLYLDDCFTDLAPSGGPLQAAIRDPAAGFEIRVTAEAPPVRAVQVYAPPDQAFVVLEPQLNWPDPFASLWRGAETGMALMQPGQSLAYEVGLQVSGLHDAGLR